MSEKKNIERTRNYHCPNCDRYWRSNYKVCPKDGTPLVHVGSVTTDYDKKEVTFDWKKDKSVKPKKAKKATKKSVRKPKTKE